MTITKLDKRLFSSPGTGSSDPDSTLAASVFTATLESRIKSELTCETFDTGGSLEKALKIIDDAVTDHCAGGCDKTEIGVFPPAQFDKVFRTNRGFGADPDYLVVEYFRDLDKLHGEGRKPEDLPWGYGKKRDAFFKSAGAVQGDSFARGALGALKWFLGALLAAALCLLSYFVMDGRLEGFLGSLNSGGGLLIGFALGLVDLALRFGSWFVFIIAGLGALAMLGVSLFTLVTSGPDRSARKRMALDYVDAMRFVRLRILWFQNKYKTDSVPKFLVEAEYELLNRAAGMRKALKKELHSDWLPIHHKYSIARFNAKAKKAPEHSIDPSVKALMDSDRFSPRFTEAEAASFIAVAAQSRGLVGEAIRYFTIAAEAGSAHGAWAAAQLCLAELKPRWEKAQSEEDVHKSLGYPMRCLKPDLEAAEKLARMAKDMGHPMAGELLEEIQLKQAHIYGRLGEDAKEAQVRKLLGEGMDYSDVFHLCWQDEQVRALHNKAGRAHRALADAGHIWSTYWIAVYLCQSAANVAEAKEACRWIYKLDADGHDQAHWVKVWYSQALNSLALRLDKEGKGRDAVQIFEALAAIGVGHGMFNLAIAYSRQSGRLEDALHWALKAQAAGEKNAAELAQKLEGQIKLLKYTKK